MTTPSNHNSKLAIFLHGWAGTKNTWFSPIHSLPSLLESRGYRTIVPSLPGRYISEDKDLNWYANYVDQLIEKANSENPIAKIILIGYSLGGVLARYYAKSAIGTPAFKKKITQVITIASPHHGTNTEIIDIASQIFEKASEMNPIPLGHGSVNEVVQAIAKAPCYLQVKPDSEFLENLNQSPNGPPGIEWHSIRTRGDKIVTPSISAVLTGASNYFINNSMIGHIAIRWMPVVHDLIEQILDGKAQPSGLQAFPPPEGCAKSHFHNWIPVDHWDQKTPDNHPRFLFECTHCGQATWHTE